MATLSNCGEFLKLYLPSISRKSVYGRGNDLGYGKNDRDIMDNPQPSPNLPVKYGCSSQTKWQWVPSWGLRYSRTLSERIVSVKDSALELGVTPETEKK